MILGYLAYLVVFFFGFFCACVVAGGKIESLERKLAFLEEVLAGYRSKTRMPGDW